MRASSSSSVYFCAILLWGPMRRVEFVLRLCLVVSRARIEGANQPRDDPFLSVVRRVLMFRALVSGWKVNEFKILGLSGAGWGAQDNTQPERTQVFVAAANPGRVYSILSQHESETCTKYICYATMQHINARRIELNWFA